MAKCSEQTLEQGDLLWDPAHLLEASCSTVYTAVSSSVNRAYQQSLLHRIAVGIK